MKPNDGNGKLPTSARPFRVFIISGSDRRQYNCPGVDSKSRALTLRMAARLPQEWEIDYEDLGNVYARARIQTCNACVSTSMALCVWPCNFYEKNHRSGPDLRWDFDMYARLDLADAWAVIGPVNWYAPTSNLKAMFDRLVCMNGGDPREDLIEHEDAELATETDVFRDFDAWVDAFAAFVGAKGKVEPGRWRAYGYEAPGDLGADLKAKFRELRTGLGFPPPGSSPAKQEELGLNEDLTLRPWKSEGEKLREE